MTDGHVPAGWYPNSHGRMQYWDGSSWTAHIEDAPAAQPGPAGPYPYASDPAAPFGRDPSTGEPLSDKSKTAAGLLQIFLGTLGIGRFYMGSVGIGLTQLLLFIFGFVTLIIFIGFFLIIGVSIWALVDGIVILTGRPRDGRGYLLRS